MTIPADEISQMAELYMTGERSIQSLADQFKRNDNAIARHFKKRGIEIKQHNFRLGNKLGCYKGKEPRNPLEYFNSSYIIDENTHCWEWQRGKNKRGYGQFWIIKTMIGAHRFSYFHHKGEIEKGLIICHTCDNPGCVNPQHLFLGTHQDNADDKVKKGRSRYVKGTGRKVNNRRIDTLSDWDWLIIGEVRKLGMKGIDIAKLYKISVQALYEVLKQKNI